MYKYHKYQALIKMNCNMQLINIHKISQNISKLIDEIKINSLYLHHYQY